ncbi:hypothetical protein ACLKMH_16990 [Psychromonas sp. KJ10-10]|uniref:hypothetical protein n=1 Tax=Psychromonas sp. KJ10-10 TaxID=3391823 RepID=UPI0039B3D361
MFSSVDLPNHPLSKLFAINSDNSHEFNYYPLANNRIYDRLITLPFKESENATLDKEALIYIKVFKDGKQELNIKSFLDEDFDNEGEKIEFVKEAYSEATFYALHYRLTPLDKIGLEGIQAETRAISRFATHLTKKLEEELASVEAMIEVTDRTADIVNSVMAKEISMVN